MLRVSLVLWVLPVWTASAAGWMSTPVADVEEGNTLFRCARYDLALLAYERASAAEQVPTGLAFNLGTTMIKMGRLEEARRWLYQALRSRDEGLKKQVHYNLGNSFLLEGLFDQAAQSYRRALLIDPGHHDARYNLEIALRHLPPPRKPLPPGCPPGPGPPPPDELTEWLVIDFGHAEKPTPFPPGPLFVPGWGPLPPERVPRKKRPGKDW